jgi:ankyrin repeat protein
MKVKKSFFVFLLLIAKPFYADIVHKPLEISQEQMEQDLLNAAWLGETNIVKTFIDKYRIDPKKVIDELGDNVLIYAVKGNTESMTQSGTHPALIKFLLERGVAINHANNEGNTALMIAAQLGDYAMVQYLLSNGADKTRTNNAGETALALAKKHKPTFFERLKLKKENYHRGGASYNNTIKVLEGTFKNPF